MLLFWPRLLDYYGHCPLNTMDALRWSFRSFTKNMVITFRIFFAFHSVRIKYNEILCEFGSNNEILKLINLLHRLYYRN